MRRNRSTPARTSIRIGTAWIVCVRRREGPEPSPRPCGQYLAPYKIRAYASTAPEHVVKFVTPSDG